MNRDEQEEKIRENATVEQGDDGNWYASYGKHKVKDLTAYSAVDTLVNRIMFGESEGEGLSFA